MQITSKYASNCSRCGEIVARGERVEWVRGVQGVRHLACNPLIAAEFQGELAQERAADAAMDAETDARDEAVIRAAFPQIAAGTCVVAPMRRVANVQQFADANHLTFERTLVIGGHRVSYLVGESKSVVACEYRPRELRLVEVA